MEEISFMLSLTRELNTLLKQLAKSIWAITIRPIISNLALWANAVRSGRLRIAFIPVYVVASLPAYAGLAIFIAFGTGAFRQCTTSGSANPGREQVIAQAEQQIQEDLRSASDNIGAALGLYSSMWGDIDLEVIDTPQALHNHKVLKMDNVLKYATPIIALIGTVFAALTFFGVSIKKKDAETQKPSA